MYFNKYLLEPRRKSTDVYINVISIFGTPVKGSEMMHYEGKLSICPLFWSILLIRIPFVMKY